MEESGKSAWSLREIFESINKKQISLPTVQRGFVWKPYQIENLWDSLLRGYPVGSFVVSKLKTGENKLELLDGQQRASAICLGIYNPVEEINDINKENFFFKTSPDHVRIFIDRLKPNNIDDNRKYLFRVITRFHPWGYQIRDNRKTLGTKEIHEVMSFYKQEKYDYLKTDLGVFSPARGYDPYPLGIFISAAINKNKEGLAKLLQKWKKSKKIFHFKMEQQGRPPLYEIEELYEAVKTMVETQKIPILYINDFEKKHDDKPIELIRKDNDDDENEKLDDIENLFVRLNSGGTPLSGEELNYSILKNHIKPDLQAKIEEKCKGMFCPGRFITIAFRLFNSLDEDSKNERDTINMKIKPKQFQQYIKKKKKKFIDFIENYFVKEDLIGQVRDFIVYKENSNDMGLPWFVSSVLADRAPEMVFMLLYRVLIKKDKFKNDSIKKRVLGIITLFVWLGKGENQKNYSKLLKQIWPCMKKFEMDRFWSQETVQRALIPEVKGDHYYDVLTPFPKLKELSRLLHKRGDIGSFTRSKILDNGYEEFVDKIFFDGTKDIVLFAQRKALSRWFSQIEGYHLDDTNRPFDWDHICPESAIKKKKKIHDALKEWYVSNGNFRAWPYSWNRQDQDSSPGEKLNPEGEEEMEFWKKQNDYEEDEGVSSYLLKKSFCDEGWSKINNNDIKNENLKKKQIAKKIVRCILHRNYELCREWYKTFEIDELYSEKLEGKDVKTIFKKFLKFNMWEGKKDEEDQDYWDYELQIDEEVHIYLCVNIEYETLKENGVYFCVWEEGGHAKIPSKFQDKYIEKSKEELCGRFTLMTYEDDSVVKLLQDILKWMDRFPSEKVKNKMLSKFKKSIVKRYRKIL